MNAMNAMHSCLSNLNADSVTLVCCSCSCPAAAWMPSQLQQLKQQFEQQPHPNLAYPSYYTVPFHAYDEGNLNWQVSEGGGGGGEGSKGGGGGSGEGGVTQATGVVLRVFGKAVGGGGGGQWRGRQLKE